MYQVYCSSLYNAFIKELRKNANLSIRQFSEICNLSTGTLSSFENSDNILQNEKTEKLLQYYGYNVGEIIDFDVEFSRLFYEFIHHAVYVQHDLIDDSHEMLMNLLKRYENTALYLGYHIINLFYSIYKDDYFDFDLKYIMKYIDYVSVDIQSLFYTYLGRYYTKINSFDQARKSFEKAQSAIAIDDTYSEMFHYTIANYYMRIGDIHLSIKHSELGIGLFVRKHNFRRLINSNILLANQFLKMKNYPRALNVNLENLNLANEKGYSFEKRVSLHNIAFIYMMKNDYQEAVLFYEQMPIQEMREKHFYAYMICLVEIGDLIKAEKMCEEGIKISHLKYYKHMFNVYKKYFTHKNKKRLNNQIIKAMQIFSSQIDLFEKEFLHMLVAHHYKELGLQKEAYTYLEKILHNSL